MVLCVHVQKNSKKGEKEVGKKVCPAWRKDTEKLGRLLASPGNGTGVQPP